VLSEIAERSAESPIVTQADGIPTGDIVNTGQAVNAQIGYLFNNNVEVAGRFSSINYDNVVGKASPKQYTLGVSKYIVGHKLKVQADLTKSVLDDQDEEVMLRTGFEFHF
jgi:uncharacterized surface anchored protein